jgi:hypothetical protein
MTATVIIRGDAQRAMAKRMIDAAPLGHVVTVRQPTRSGEQNDRLWALLTDVARAKPDGREMRPDDWKCAFMAALGHKGRYIIGLDGDPFPVGYRSSKLTVAQMSDLQTFIEQWGSERGVIWSEPQA